MLEALTIVGIKPTCVVHLELVPSDPKCTMLQGTGWTVGIRLTHLVHQRLVPSYPKCHIAQWNRNDNWDQVYMCSKPGISSILS